MNLEAKGVVGHLVIETQKRSSNDRSGSVSNEIAIGWFDDFNNWECFSAQGSPSALMCKYFREYLSEVMARQ